MAMTLRPAQALARIAALAFGASALVSCASTQSASDAPGSEASGAVKSVEADLKSRPIPDDPIGRAAYWAQRAELEPGDVQVSVQFAKALRGIGSNERAVEFLEEKLAAQAGNADLLVEYGKSLAAAGRPADAIAVLAQAQQMRPQDWSIPLAIGVAYDQMRDFRTAQSYYQAALALAPDNPAILNNIGLSYLMAGDRATAAKYLRMAAAAPGADERVMANLALVMDVPVQQADAGDAAAPDASDALPKPAVRSIDTKTREPSLRGAR